MSPKTYIGSGFQTKEGQYGRVDVVSDAVFDETRRYSMPTKRLESEDAVSTLTDGLEGTGTGNWPTVLT